MGISLDDVCDGQVNHSAEFTCAVCFGLVDAPLLTTCQHVFCMSCLQDWMANKPSCPTCNNELDPRHGAGELKLAAPLAWRVLGRLRVRCPLHSQGCLWTGEYSELTSHLTSSESHLVSNCPHTCFAITSSGMHAATDYSQVAPKDTDKKQGNAIQNDPLAGAEVRQR